MRKKIATLLAICLASSFSSCSSSVGENSGESNSNANGNSQTSGGFINKQSDNSNADNSQETSQLQHISEMMGCYSTSEGFYYYKNHNGETYEDEYENLMYIDYQSQREVYLCSKSNCDHNDDSCTSYINLLGAQGLFTYNDKLYRLSDAYSNDGTTIVPGLFVSDLDGANQKMIYSLESGMSWSRDFVIGDGLIYADVMVMETMESDDGFIGMSGDNNNSQLMAIDLSSGKAEKVLDLKNKEIIGTLEQCIILNEQKDNKLAFSKYDTKTGEETSIGEIKLTYTFCMSGDTIYYALEKENKIYALNITSGEITTVAENLPSVPDFLEFYDGYIVYSTTTEDLPAHYAVDIKKGDVKNINLYQSGMDFKYPIEIKADLGEYFLVIYGVKMEKEYVDWVGVWQEYIDKQLFALIKKDDFFDGKGEYLKITE